MKQTKTINALTVVYDYETNGVDHILTFDDENILTEEKQSIEIMCNFLGVTEEYLEREKIFMIADIIDSLLRTTKGHLTVYIMNDKLKNELKNIL